MAIAHCSKCDALIDIDYYPEVIRKEVGNTCICDSCWEEDEAAEAEWRQILAFRDSIHGDNT